MKTYFPRLVLLTLFLLLAVTMGEVYGRAAGQATIVVDSFGDDILENGNCTLREAIGAANSDSAVDKCPAGSGRDTIVLSEGFYTLTIPGEGEDAGATGDLDITDDLTLTGQGKDSTFLDGGGLDRVLHIQDSIEVSIEKLAVQNGYEGITGGGGIYNQGSLTVTLSTVQDNRAGNQAGGILNVGKLSIINSMVRDNQVLPFGDGGGIYNQGILEINASTIMNNSAYGRGGIANSGVLTMTNSTVSGNNAAFMGGIGSNGSATLNNVTIAKNVAAEPSSAGGIEGQATIRNSILENNPGGNCLGSITSAGYNLDSGVSCKFNNQGDLSNVGAHIGPLGDNGGPTFTHSLLAGSPAIDTGSCMDMDGKPVTVDQRGMTRPEGPGCDIGSFEGQAFSTYYPFIAKSPPVELVVTSRGETIGYPTYWWVYGHVNNLVSRPVYSVTIGIEVTYYPYCEPDTCEPYDMTEIVRPAFEATLPGQANPFSWNIALGKASAMVGEVKIASGGLIGEGGKSFYPVTILNWTREGKAVAGRVRNDSGKNLSEVRVVVFSNECAWKEASLNSTNLQPGEETDFRLESFYCEGEDVAVVGQGREGQN